MSLLVVAVMAVAALLALAMVLRTGGARSVPSRVWTPAASSVDAEALVARASAEQIVCRDCGPRPEHAPMYCSACGRCLLACWACGTRAGEVGARHCSQCGSALAG